MPLMECPKCGELILDKSARCRYCGEPDPAGYAGCRIVFSLIVAVVGAILTYFVIR